MWYVIQTKSGEENKLKELIDVLMPRELYNECFVALYEDVWRKGGVGHISIKRLFPGYLFIDTSSPDSVYDVIKSIPRFTRLLGTPEKDGSKSFIKVTEEEMEFLSTLLKNSVMHVSYIRMHKNSNKIESISGPLAVHASRIARLDKILERFTHTDNTEQIIENFLLTLHSFFNFKSNQIIGDTGQIIILGGKKSDGSYYYNEYTSLFIKCLKKLKLPDPKLMLRCGVGMPKRILLEAVECIETGIGSPLLSNDDIIIPNLVEFGYDADDAYNYGVSACWEPLSIGNSLEQNNLAQIEYGRVMNETIMDERFLACYSLEDILEIYFEHLKIHIDIVLSKIDEIEWEQDPIQTLFTLPCLERNRDISNGGAKYNNYGILSVGMSAAVDSLINLERYCIGNLKQYTLEEVYIAIKSNYYSANGMRETFLRKDNGFGTESNKAIELTNIILLKTCNIVEMYRNRYDGKVKFGLSSFAYLSNGKNCGATADGRYTGAPFNTHISRDNNESVTQILNFAAQLKYND